MQNAFEILQPSVKTREASYCSLDSLTQSLEFLCVLATEKPLRFANVEVVQCWFGLGCHGCETLLTTFVGRTANHQSAGYGMEPQRWKGNLEQLWGR